MLITIIIINYVSFCVNILCLTEIFAFDATGPFLSECNLNLIVSLSNANYT